MKPLPETLALIYRKASYLASLHRLIQNTFAVGKGKNTRAFVDLNQLLVFSRNSFEPRRSKAVTGTQIISAWIQRIPNKPDEAMK